MAVIKCPECGKEISSFAPSCPNCGIPKDYMRMLSILTMEKNRAIEELMPLYENPQTDFRELLWLIINKIDNDTHKRALTESASKYNLNKLYDYQISDAADGLPKGWDSINLSWALFYIHCFCGLGINRNKSLTDAISEERTYGTLGKTGGILPRSILTALSQWNYPAKYLLAIEQISDTAMAMGDEYCSTDEEKLGWDDIDKETLDLLKAAMDYGVIEAEMRYAILYDDLVGMGFNSLADTHEQMSIVKVNDATTGKDTYVDADVYAEIFGRKHTLTEEQKEELKSIRESIKEDEKILNQICEHLIKLGYEDFVKENITHYSHD